MTIDSKQTSTALANFTPMDLDELESQEKQIGFGNSNSNFFQFQSGRNVVRVLPGLHGAPPFITFFKHFVKGAGLDGKAWGGACPLKMAKLPCPVCAVATKLSRGASEADLDLAKELTPRKRVVANLIDRAAPDAGPQVAEMGTSIYDAIKDIKRSLGDDPTHPTDGFDLIVEKTGAGLKTEYKVVPVRQSSKVHADAGQMTEWFQDAADLAKQVIVLPEHELVIKLQGTIIGPMLTKRNDKPAARAKTGAAMDTEGGENY